MSENFAMGRGKRGASAASKEVPLAPFRRGEDSVKERSDIRGKRRASAVEVASRLSVLAASDRSQRLSSRRCGEEKASKTCEDGPDSGVQTTLSFVIAGNPEKSTSSMESTPMMSSSKVSTEDKVRRTCKLVDSSWSRATIRSLWRKPILERQKGSSGTGPVS